MGYWDDTDEDDWYMEPEQCRNISARILYETHKTSLYFLLSALIHLLDTEPVSITEDEKSAIQRIIERVETQIEGDS